MRGADILVEMLIGYGVEYVFGVPGDTNVPFYVSLQKRKGEIRHVMARDERSAGFMADAYARLTNKPGVFECPSGAGAMYSLPPVAESNASAVPVILLTIDIPLPGEGKGVITELDCARLFEPVTKMSELVKSVNKLPEVLRRAFRTACSGTPGAVHLQIPHDILLAEADETAVSLHIEAECGTFPAYPMGPSPGKIEALAALLGEAERPLLVAGGGVNRSHAGAVLTRLAEQLNVPVVSTITGQGAIEADHRLAIGVIGDNGFHPHANLALEEADVVVFVGSKLGSVVTIGFSFPTSRSNRRIAQIDINPLVLANNFETALGIAGDAGLVLGRLADHTSDVFDGSKHAGWVEHLNEYRAAFWSNAQELLQSREVPILPEHVAYALGEKLARLGQPVHIMSDAGTPTPYMTRFLKTSSRTRFVIPRAFGGLGYAIPAVVGAWFADPQRRPIGLFGDGSLGMAAGELETLVRLDVPAVLLLFNNGSFGWIKALLRLSGEETTTPVDFLPTDGRAIGQAFGLRAWRVTTPDELDTALDEAFAHDGPCLLDIVIESIADRVPPVYSWLRKRGRDPLTLEADRVGYR